MRKKVKQVKQNVGKRWYDYVFLLRETETKLTHRCSESETTLHFCCSSVAERNLRKPLVRLGERRSVAVVAVNTTKGTVRKQNHRVWPQNGPCGLFAARGGKHALGEDVGPARGRKRRFRGAGIFLWGVVPHGGAFVPGAEANETKLLPTTGQAERPAVRRSPIPPISAATGRKPGPTSSTSSPHASERPAGEGIPRLRSLASPLQPKGAALGFRLVFLLLSFGGLRK